MDDVLQKGPWVTGPDSAAGVPVGTLQPPGPHWGGRSSSTHWFHLVCALSKPADAEAFFYGFAHSGIASGSHQEEPCCSPYGSSSNPSAAALAPVTCTGQQ